MKSAPFKPFDFDATAPVTAFATPIAAVPETVLATTFATTFATIISAIIATMLALPLAACSLGKVSVQSNAGPGTQNPGGVHAGNHQFPGIGNEGSSLKSAVIAFSIRPEDERGSRGGDKIGFLPANSETAVPFSVPVPLSESARIDRDLVVFGDRSIVYIKTANSLQDAITETNLANLASHDIFLSDVPIQAISASPDGTTVFFLDVKGRVYRLVKSDGGFQAESLSLPNGFDAKDLHGSGRDKIIVKGLRDGAPSCLIFSLAGGEPKLEAKENAMDVSFDPTGVYEAVIVDSRSSEGDSEAERLFVKTETSTGGASKRLVAKGPRGSIHEPSWSSGELLAYWQKVGTETAEVRVVDLVAGVWSAVATIVPIPTTIDLVCPAWVGGTLFFSGLERRHVHSIMRAYRNPAGQWETSVFARPGQYDGAYVCPHISVQEPSAKGNANPSPRNGSHPS